MYKFVIEGGIPLKGEVAVSGSKNAALPILCSSILSDGICSYTNIPRLKDIDTIIKVLSILGVEIKMDEDNVVSVNPGRIKAFEAPYELVKSMRASKGPYKDGCRYRRVSWIRGCKNQWA